MAESNRRAPAVAPAAASDIRAPAAQENPDVGENDAAEMQLD